MTTLFRFLLLPCLAIALLAGADDEAQTFSKLDGKVTFTAPAGWTVTGKESESCVKLKPPQEIKEALASELMCITVGCGTDFPIEEVAKGMTLRLAKGPDFTLVAKAEDAAKGMLYILRAVKDEGTMILIDRYAQRNDVGVQVRIEWVLAQQRDATRVAAFLGQANALLSGVKIDGQAIGSVAQVTADNVK